MIRADALHLPIRDASVDLALWSPPYFAMREYGDDPHELGRPTSVHDYIKHVTTAAIESSRCVRPGGSLFINVADRYVNRARVRRSAHQPSLNRSAERPEWRETWAQASARGGVITSQIAGVREQSLALIPERLVLSLYDAGFWIKGHYVWSKTHGVPDPQATDRAVLRHESVPHVAHGPRVAASFAPGTVPSVIELAPSRGSNGHPAPWPEALCEWIIGNWSQPGDTVLDAFAGSGTTGTVARRMGRHAIEVDLYDWPQ
jgi:DNA modification methylase